MAKINQAQDLFTTNANLAVLVVLTFFYVYRLNYNTPFSDEAIYIVLGKMGLFQWDWTSFAAGNWMAGSLIAYPPLTALAYSSLGIVGSRLLNVIFGLVTILTLGSIAALMVPKPQSRTARLCTVIVFGLSAIPLFVSRLATYDMPAFCLFFLSFYSLLKAINGRTQLGKWYFFSATTLWLSILMKVVTTFYAPFLVLTAIIHALRRPQYRRRFYFFRYYFIPIVLIGLFYVSTQLPGFLVYLSTHQHAETIPYAEVIHGVSQYLVALFPLALIGTLLLLFYRRFMHWILLSFSSLWIIVIHLVTHRLSTFDKHLYFTAAFLCLMVGIGFSFLVQSPHTLLKKMGTALIVGLLIPVLIHSTQLGYQYGHTWLDTTQTTNFLKKTVNTGDYILSQEGPATMLALYQQNHPLLTATFDWYAYQGNEGLTAYAQAVKDGHFNYIVMYQNIDLVNDLYREVQAVVTASQDNTYQPVFADNSFIVYQRTY